MTNKRVMQVIREAYERNLTELNLSVSQLTQLPLEITKLENLETLNLSHNQLTQLPPEIKELKNLKELNLSFNPLIQLPAEIGELKNLTKLDLYGNRLTQLPQEIGELKNLKELSLYRNQITQLPPEIGKLRNLAKLNLPENRLTQLPREIGELKELKEFNLSHNLLTQLIPEIGELKNLKEFNLSYNLLTRLPFKIKEFENLTILDLSSNKLTRLPPEIRELKNLGMLNLSGNELAKLPSEIIELQNLRTLYLFDNQLTQLPLGIGKLKNLIALDISRNQLTHLPPGIGELKELKTLKLSSNKLIHLPSEIIELKNLIKLELAENYLTSPPPEIVSRGLDAIFTYIRQSKTTENNEAKLILVGNGEVGKTCLANRLITGKFVEDKITEGINISKWVIPAPDLENSEIKLNVWDFGGQEIYHATHQFFLTTRSVYLLVWNARKRKDYDNIYYWLHTIEAFGEDSPIILVMSKMKESDDDLNIKDLKSKFPQIVDYVKIDSSDGTGINSLKEIIRKTAWNLPLMRAEWVNSWYKVRQKLEGLEKNWITYDIFYEICVSEGLYTNNIDVLDDYLNDLGVTLHFRDRTGINFDKNRIMNDKMGLMNIVILRPEWATGAFYKILSTKSVLDNEGKLPQTALSQIWDIKKYPPSVYHQLMELMNKFELSYKLPYEDSYLVPELLPKNSPDNFEWSEEDDLCFYYCYDSFLPSGIISRFIVRMHQDIEIKENGLPLCWREGVVLRLIKSRAFVEMKPDERRIEIKIKGDNKRSALEVICYHLDHINASIKKVSVSKQIPCNCSENCLQKYLYEDLVKAERDNIEDFRCLKSFKPMSISLLLDGYKRREDRFREYNEISRQLVQNFVFSSNNMTSLEANQTMKTEQKTDVNLNINIDLNIDLPQIQTDFENLINEIKRLNPELDSSDFDKIQDSLDEVSTNSDQKELTKPFNKLRRFLNKLGDENSEYNKIIKGTQKGIEYAQKLGSTF